MYSTYSDLHPLRAWEQCRLSPPAMEFEDGGVYRNSGAVWQDADE